MTNQKHKISNNLINNFEFRIIRSNDTDFMDVCDYVEKNIPPTGGIFYSKILREVCNFNFSVFEVSNTNWELTSSKST